MPAANRETRTIVRRRVDLQRPERSGAYGDFVVYPGATYVVAAAPRDDDGGTAQVTARGGHRRAGFLDASLARFGVVPRPPPPASSTPPRPRRSRRPFRERATTRYEAPWTRSGGGDGVRVAGGGRAFGVEVDARGGARGRALARAHPPVRVQRRARACFLRQERADYGDGYRGGPRHDAHVRVSVTRSRSSEACLAPRRPVGAGVFYGVKLAGRFAYAANAVARHRVRARVRGAHRSARAGCARERRADSGRGRRRRRRERRREGEQSAVLARRAAPRREERRRGGGDRARRVDEAGVPRGDHARVPGRGR